MKRKSKATIILLTMLLLSGCSGCVLVLRDYFAPMFSNSEGSVVLNIETYIDGKKVREVDQLNFICYVNGTDYLADVRKALGM